MSTKLRLGIWAGFLVVATIFALAFNGWHQTKWMLLAFYVLGIGYNSYLYFKYMKKLWITCTICMVISMVAVLPILGFIKNDAVIGDALLIAFTLSAEFFIIGSISAMKQ